MFPYIVYTLSRNGEKGMEKLFEKPKDFREKATEKDVRCLLEYYKGMPSKYWEEDDCPYGFSRSSAVNLLRERGLLDPVEKDKEELNISFKKLETKQRTLYITDNVWERLQNIFDDYESVDKKNVLDAFLKKALEQMGY